MSDHRKRPQPYTLNHWVVGSIPTRCILKIRDLQKSNKLSATACATVQHEKHIQADLGSTSLPKRTSQRLLRSALRWRPEQMDKSEDQGLRRRQTPVAQTP